uniref:Uncharacterized protein n=1 Tax=Glossina austeni TaxID=7395 RepID=A0A1A9VMN9_GLOAU
MSISDQKLEIELQNLQLGRENKLDKGAYEKGVNGILRENAKPLMMNRIHRLVSVPVLVDNLSAVVVVEEAELPDDELPAQLFTAVTAKKLLYAVALAVAVLSAGYSFNTMPPL